jgi:hypothetical protein
MHISLFPSLSLAAPQSPSKRLRAGEKANCWRRKSLSKNGKKAFCGLSPFERARAAETKVQWGWQIGTPVGLRLHAKSVFLSSALLVYYFNRASARASGRPIIEIEPRCPY